ncbi:YtxH domain-containing protein [Hoylesella saccharolytica]|uniref:YtxH domain-containing protein n=1 Tax=Hoylesella saccharolytica TaxID=633701 RepID=UPI00046EA9DA|nr:YtxH domain-containing protein [Hoylesella saccharolytica]
MSKIANTLFGFAAGTAVGVGLGLLFAQDKGENTRKKIKDSVRDTVDELKEQLESLTKSLRNKSSEIKGTLEERVDNLLSDTDYNSEDLIDLLEKKLASMKKAAKKQVIKQ